MSNDQPRSETSDAAAPTEAIETAAPMDETRPFDLEPPEHPTLAFELPPTDDLPAPAPAPETPAFETPATANTAAPESAPAAAPITDQPRALRVGTVVWGLILAVIGAGVIAVAAGAQFDLELALIGLLILAGAGLLAGSIVTSVRRRKR